MQDMKHNFVIGGVLFGSSVVVVTHPPLLNLL